jgi:glycosyltransferase involved in cell wall biosynthesis
LSGDDRAQRVAVVIPARNESACIGPVLAETSRLYPDYDIVVVDDASDDGTGGIARSAGAIVLRAPIQLGYGGAVQTGFKYAYARNYDLVVLLDADGQHDARYVADLVDASREYDFVVGSRFRGRTHYDIPPIRLAGMKVFSAIASVITGQRITDTSSGFQALLRRVFSLFATTHYPADFPDADTIIWIARHGFKVGEVPVEMHQRVAGRSMISGLASSLKYALKMPLAILVTLLRIPAAYKEEDAE